MKLIEKLKVEKKVEKVKKNLKSQETSKYIEIKKKLKMKLIEKSKAEKKIEKIEKKLIEKKPKIIYIKYSNIKAHNGVRKKKARRT